MANDDLINQTLGRGQYEIRAVLGRGGMATVYLARQASMERDVAVKVMTPELADDEAFVERFEREAQVIALLQHPHILPVIDFGKEGEHIYIVMRLVRGGSLDQRLAHGPLDLPLASRMLGQIASALSFAHEQGIIHRDLKPNNVLLDKRDNAYLTDFGIAKMLAGTTQLTATGNILGTPAYMAPEQWRGEAIDARTDIYALGVMLYEMVLGRLPFTGDTPYTLMYKHFNDAPPPPREINPALPPVVEQVILRAMAKDPDQRYQSAEDLAADFANAVHGRPTVAGSAVAPEDMLETLVGDEDVLPAPVTPTAAASSAPPTRANAPTNDVAEIAPPRKRPTGLLVGVALVVLMVLGAVGVWVLGGKGEEVATPTDTPTATRTATATATPTATFTLTPSPTPRTTTATILAERANVRSGPGLDYDVIGALSRDEEALVTGVSEDGGWYQVVFQTRLGWVSAEAVRISGNPNIAVVALPTETPLPTDTPTPTRTPTPSAMPSPTPTEVVGVQRDIVLPTEFAPTTITELGLTFDYPTNWPQPAVLSVLALISPLSSDVANSDDYPSIALARGTREQLLNAGITSDTSDLKAALEHPFQTDFSGTTKPTSDFAFPGYVLDLAEEGTHVWGWIFEIGSDDWLYILAIAPSSAYDQEFGERVLGRMVRSMQVDGQSLSAAAHEGVVLTGPPLSVGEHVVIDGFDNNANDWRFGEIVDGQLIVSAYDTDTYRWAYPYTVAEGATAYYAQVTGQLLDNVNRYAYGMNFRIGETRFYTFMLTHEGTFALYKVLDGTWTPLVPETEWPGVRLGVRAPNTFGVLVIGGYIELYLNGERVAALVDESLPRGGAFPALYVYPNIPTPLSVAFDNYIYGELALAPQSLDAAEGAVATATLRENGPMRLYAQDNAEILGMVNAKQPLAALARSEDGRFVYGYAQGMAGWIEARVLALQRGGEPLLVSALPILDANFAGEIVTAWPVPEQTPPAQTEVVPTATSSPLPPPGMLVYEQEVRDELALNGLSRWLFQGQAGDLVTVIASPQDAPDLLLRIAVLAADDTELCHSSGGVAGEPIMVGECELPQSGLYTVRIEAFSGEGRFTLSVLKQD